MQGISKYGALAAKIRGMRSYLLTEEELVRLAGMNSVKDIVLYLKNHPGYSRALAAFDPEAFGRESFERLLVYSAVIDNRKIYMFLDHDQRQYFRKAFIKTEIRFLKNRLRLIFNPYTSPVDLSIYRTLFTDKHCSFNFDKVFRAETPEEFIRALDGTIYEEPLRRLREINPAPDLFEYQRCLDMFYYTYIWDAAKKYGDKYDREVLMKTNGEETDMLNLMCIYRIKAHFDVPEAEIFHYLIPAYYKLKRPQLAGLAACRDTDEFMKACKNTYYGRYIDTDAPGRLEADYISHMEKNYDRMRRNYPYSFAIVEAYSFNKRTEIEQLISITESVLYGYPQKTILENLHIGGSIQ